MKVKFFVLSIFAMLLIPLAVAAGASVNLQRVTNDGSQQTQPIVSKKLIAYTNHGGSQGIDIWAFNRETGINSPLIERPGQQFLTGLYRNLVVYEDFDEATSDYNVRLYNTKNNQDELIAGGPGAQTTGVTNGKYVVYINGGACGSLNAYDLKKNTTFEITASACAPISISGDTVVWAYGAPGGTNIYGYDFKKKVLFDVATADGFQEVPSVLGDNVAFLDRASGAYGDYNAIMVKNIKTGKQTKVYESLTNSLNGPALSNQYVVWSESSAPHIGGVKAANLKTGEVFEVQEQGPHQNSHTTSAIWRNMAVWQAWRTGDGDIYSATFSK